jgi:hypothetical protein
MRRMAALVAGTLCAIGPATATVAEDVAIAAWRDNTLYESSEAVLSNGIGQFLYSGTTNSRGRRRAVLAFDVAAHVPEGATISAVTLRLHLSRDNDGIHTSSLHRLTQAWGEGNSNSSLRGGGGGAPAAANDATWLHTFFPTAVWSTPGGDYLTQPSASTNIGTDSIVLWSAAAMNADVQAWLDAPGTNFGWIIITEESSSTSAKRFDSRESLTDAYRPVLFVTYQGHAVRAATWSTIKALLL